MFILPFSHIRCRSVSNLPPLLTIFPDVSSLEPAIDCRWKGTQNGEDGNEAVEETRGPCGDSDRLSGLVLLSDHSGPHVHSSLWRRCARRCSGSAMGRDHGWVEIIAFGQITTEAFDVGQRKYKDWLSHYLHVGDRIKRFQTRKFLTCQAIVGIFQYQFIVTKFFSVVSVQRSLKVAGRTCYVIPCTALLLLNNLPL